MTYCPHGCVNGMIEDGTRNGVVCLDHPPAVNNLDVRDATTGPETGWENAPYRDYLKSSEWKRRRRHALERGDHQCALCGATKYLNVHHLTYERRGHEDPEDLIVLCRPCHGATHDLLGSQA